MFAVYLQDSCRCPSTSLFPCQPLTVDPPPDRFAGFVFLSRDPSPIRRELHCLLIIRSPPRMQIHVQIEAVDIPMIGGTCRGAILQIYDGPTTDDLKRQLVGETNMGVVCWEEGEWVGKKQIGLRFAWCFWKVNA